MRNVRTMLQTTVANFGSNYVGLLAYLDDFSLHECRKLDEIDLDQALSNLGLGYCRGKSKEAKFRMLKEEVERRAKTKRR